MKSKSILVMRFSSIGDIIQTTSTLSTIKEYLPNYTIDYLTLDHFKSILKNHKSLNKVYSISKNAKYSHISELILKLQSNKYDYIIDLHNSPRSKAFSLFLKKSKIKKIKKPRLKRFFLFLFHFNSFKENFNADIFGPLAFDNSISKKSASIKGIENIVAGEADVLLVPNVETGNALVKMMIYFMGACAAGVVVGGKVPVVITSRSDDATARLASIAAAVVALD